MVKEFADQGSFGIGVVVDVSPLATTGEFTLEGRVAVPVSLVPAQPVTKQQVVGHLG
jgi:hypothetical protein